MIENFAKVTDNLYRGGKISSMDELLELKNKYRINKIISLDKRSGEDIDNATKKLGIIHKIFAIGTGHPSQPISELKKIIPTLENNGPTYIHCYHGKDRTGMAIAMYRIYKGMSFQDAIKEAYKYGMGKGLSDEVALSYYDAVKQYNHENKKSLGNFNWKSFKMIKGK